MTRFRAAKRQYTVVRLTGATLAQAWDPPFGFIGPEIVACPTRISESRPRLSAVDRTSLATSRLAASKGDDHAFQSDFVDGSAATLMDWRRSEILGSVPASLGTTNASGA